MLTFLEDVVSTLFEILHWRFLSSPPSVYLFIFPLSLRTNKYLFYSLDYNPILAIWDVLVGSFAHLPFSRHCIFLYLYFWHWKKLQAPSICISWFSSGRNHFSKKPWFLLLENSIRNQNAGLDNSQAGLKIAGRNINIRYANDTTLMAESEEEPKSLLIKVNGWKRVEKVGLKLSTRKTKIMASSSITSWTLDGEIMETVTDLFS